MTKRALIIFESAGRDLASGNDFGAYASTPGVAALREALLADAAERYHELDVDIRLYLEDDGHLRLPVAGGVQIVRGHIRGPELLTNVMRTFGAGYTAACILRAEYAAVPAEFLSAAFDALDDPLSVALGPGEEGDVYAVAVNDLFPDVLHAVGTDARFDDVLKRAASSAAGVIVLPPWYSVSGVGGRLRLAEDLSADPHRHAPRTRSWIADASDRHPNVM